MSLGAWLYKSMCTHISCLMLRFTGERNTEFFYSICFHKARVQKKRINPQISQALGWYKLHSKYIVFACRFCWPNADHVTILRRFEPLLFSWKRPVCASIKMCNFERRYSPGYCHVTCIGKTKSMSEKDLLACPDDITNTRDFLWLNHEPKHRNFKLSLDL